MHFLFFERRDWSRNAQRNMHLAKNKWKMSFRTCNNHSVVMVHPRPNTLSEPNCNQDNYVFSRANIINPSTADEYIIDMIRGRHGRMKRMCAVVTPLLARTWLNSRHPILRTRTNLFTTSFYLEETIFYLLEAVLEKNWWNEIAVIC